MRCISVDFKVLESKDPETLIVGDVSRDWYIAENKPAYLKITLPGSKRTKNFTFIKNQINVFNSITLGLNKFKGNCQEESYINLPDGVYKIELVTDFEGIKIEKFYLKTDLIKKNIAKKIVDNYIKDKTETEALYNKISDIDKKIMVAESFTIDGYYKEANKFFTEAINEYKCL